MINNLSPLFIIGHKRSGSTFLGKVLNMHPEIFVSNETDVLWLLYQYFNYEEIAKHKFDGDVGLNMCLKLFGHLLDRAKTPFELFCQIQLAAMSEGFMTNPSAEKPNLKYLGDQKPFQNADPKLVKFAAQNFPTTKYIHLIRNPYDVISSCKKFGKHKDGGWMWKDKTKDRILRQWVKAEKWVAKLKAQDAPNVHDIRYEDLIENPRQSIRDIFQFLELDYEELLIDNVENAIVKKERHREKDFQITDEASFIMKTFDYL